MQHDWNVHKWRERETFVTGLMCQHHNKVHIIIVSMMFYREMKCEMSLSGMHDAKCQQNYRLWTWDTKDICLSILLYFGSQQKTDSLSVSWPVFVSFSRISFSYSPSLYLVYSLYFYGNSLCPNCDPGDRLSFTSVQFLNLWHFDLTFVCLLW